MNRIGWVTSEIWAIEDWRLQRKNWKKFEKIFGKPRLSTDRILERHKNIASSIQKFTEEIYIRILNHLYKVEATEIGAVLNYNDSLYFSYRLGSSYYLMKQSLNLATGYYQSLRLIPDPKFLRDYFFAGVNVYMTPYENSQLKVYYRINGKGGFKVATLSTGDTYTSDNNSNMEFFRIGEKGNFIEIALDIIPVGQSSINIKMLEE